jgi:hypothetical protein
MNTIHTKCLDLEENDKLHHVMGFNHHKKNLIDWTTVCESHIEEMQPRYLALTLVCPDP